MKKQEGIVLVIALIMLIAVTLIAVTGANISLAQLKVVQNFEAKQHMRMLANNAIEEAIVTPGFLQGAAQGAGQGAGSAIGMALRALISWLSGGAI